MIKTITLATLAESSESEVINFVAHHLLTQFERSESSVGCAYHSRDGLKCAAGCLISESEWRGAWEGDGWHTLVRDGLVPEEHSRLIQGLQKIHDRRSPYDWPRLLEETATEFGVELEPEVRALLGMRRKAAVFLFEEP